MNTAGFQLAPDIKGDSDEDTELLLSMADDARAYLQGMKWCPSLRRLYLAFGIGGVVAVFLAELDPKSAHQDQFLWIVVGDLPSAYLVAESATPREALETYCALMADWIEAVELGRSLDEVFPVAANPTPEAAAQLRRRIKFLKERILPSLA